MENVRMWQDFLLEWRVSVDLTGDTDGEAESAREAFRVAFPGQTFDVVRERTTGHGTVHYRKVWI